MQLVRPSHVWMSFQESETGNKGIFPVPSFVHQFVWDVLGIGKREQRDVPEMYSRCIQRDVPEMCPRCILNKQCLQLTIAVINGTRRNVTISDDDFANKYEVLV